MGSRGLSYLGNVKAKPYFNTGFWSGSGYYGFCIGRHNLRVELYISSDKDKHYFNELFHKDEIEKTVRDKIIWQKLENKKASRIKIEPTESENHPSEVMRRRPL